EEALTMSDRIAVMSSGQVEQVATPERMYEEPETVFVADFLGVSNLMEVTAEGQDGSACRTKLGDFTLHAGCGEVGHRGEPHVVIRPGRAAIEPYETSGENPGPGRTDRVAYHAAPDRLVVRPATGAGAQAPFANAGARPGRATNGLGFVVADRGPRELVELATDDQLERWLRPVLRREVVEAWAVTEPGAGSDVGGIAATATRDGDDWVLDGEKWFVTGGDV